MATSEAISDTLKQLNTAKTQHVQCYGKDAKSSKASNKNCLIIKTGLVKQYWFMRKDVLRADEYTVVLI